MWKILIIDDDFQVLEGMKKSIDWDGLDAEWVGEALDGEEGLQKIRETKPDIVITDIYMPVMNGLEMIEQLREEDFAGELIILSGYSDFQYARQALRLQVSDYLSKPVTLEELRSVLERVIRGLEAKELKQLEQEEVRRRLRMYEPFVQKEWLKSIVTGTMDQTMMLENMAESEQHVWLERSHLLMGIEIMRTDRISNLSLADWNLFRFAMSNIIHELLAEAWEASELIELHSHQAAVLFHIDPAMPEDEALKQIRLIGQRITDCVWTYLKLQARIGLGGIKDWQSLSDSTEEAFLDLLQQSMIPEQGERDRSLVQEGAEITLRPIKFYQELAEAIVSSKEETIRRIVDDYLQQLQLMPTITPAYLQYLCSELWTILSYTLYKVGIVLDELFPEHSPTQEIGKITTVEALRQWLTEQIHVIASSRGWNENSRHKEAVDFMIQYVHEHYAEEITLEGLSKQLYLSRNYLNQIFKKASGETFTTYLIRVRMEKAKALLIEGKYMIYEIAEQVGYKNVPYFSSIFKKYHGVNPSDFGKK
ncbi:response regulator transcription factor [Paenibacillus cremeus]|uniref:Response regulator transcription factor n=1 Tax=Paenibacillus cremeus TaxID=2163881 RepID=A0A559KDS2_9BACL|nr:response regulator transcription factor [Paenibacillus cremeus]TVY10282.1 response regulator transcription factor [Paenibacillus cremeus]